MRSLLGSILNSGPPVPLASRRFSAALGNLVGLNTDRTSQLGATSGSSTLFAVIDALATGVAEPGWHLHQAVRDKGAVCGYESETGHPCEARGHRWVEQHAALTVWERPNPWFTRQEFMEVGQQHTELAGECWWVITRVGRIPVEIWPVRPDRMDPIPHPTKYLSGYIYTSPDGEQVPLKLDEVIFIRRPNPLDPYRGLSPIASLMVDLDAASAAAEWNRNFFRNSAEPGGVIEVDKVLTDPEFERMVLRWNESHKGVGRAHRVAVLEHGKWIDRKYTNRDMEFSTLRGISREMVREAYRLHGHMLGLSEDVNLANSLAADVTFTRRLIKPRLGRWSGALNNDFIRMFAGGDRGDLKFVPDNPVPEDREGDATELTARTGAAKVLVDAGYDKTEVLAAVGLPDIAVSSEPKPAPIIMPPAQPGDNPVEDEPVPGDDPIEDATRRIVADVRAALGAPCGHDHTVRNAADDDDLDPQYRAIQDDWEVALAALLAAWAPISTAQREELLEQIRTAVDDSDLAALAKLTVDTDDAEAELLAALVGMSTVAAQRMVDEAASQGVNIEPAEAERTTLEGIAGATAVLLGQGLATSAGKEALRLYTPDSTSSELVRQVEEFLAGLSDAYLKDQLGGALTWSQNLARGETLKGAPEAKYFAVEKLDRNTCKPCRDIDGTQFPGLMEALTAYGGGPYWGCLGGNRCRGTYEARWDDIEVPE